MSAETSEPTMHPGDGPLPAAVDVVIVGSGFAGLGAAIKLRGQGREFVVLERADDVGGTWRDNSYPGCACDVPSHLYSFSFAPNPDWTYAFSRQGEIQDYLRRTARDFGVLPFVRFGAEVRGAKWLSAERRWHISTTRGDVLARVLVSGAGALSEPSVPDLPGLEGFEGTAFHSAAWRHDHDLTGERVAVIGTGASAIQFVAQIQRQASRLIVFQRTAPWILPRRDRRIGPTERRVYRRFPPLQRVARAAIYAGRETWVLGFAFHPKLMALGERQALHYLEREIPDPVLRGKLTPTYRLGCKRVLLSSDYLPALRQPNVELVTDRIVEIRPREIVTAGADGERVSHPVDTIVFATGFRVTDPPIAERVRGADGRTLAERWSDGGMSALHGITVAGFPNLFMLIGPNTGLGHTSIVYMIEAQVDYLLDALAKMDAAGLEVIEPKPEVQRAYNDRLQRRLAGTVWNSGGCASWYLDAHGRNTTLWPTFTFVFRRELRTCDLEEYVTQPNAVAREPIAAST